MPITRGPVSQLALIALLTTIGCGQARPELETWPVVGTVVDQQGKPLSSGVIRFHAYGDADEADPHLITVGPIARDGSFAVKTQRQEFAYEGAVAGEYRLVVISDQTSAKGEKIPIQFEVPDRFTVEARDNALSLTIQR